MTHRTELSGYSAEKPEIDWLAQLGLHQQREAAGFLAHCIPTILLFHAVHHAPDASCCFDPACCLEAFRETDAQDSRICGYHTCVKHKDRPILVRSEFGTTIHGLVLSSSQSRSRLHFAHHRRTGRNHQPASRSHSRSNSSIHCLSFSEHRTKSGFRSPARELQNIHGDSNGSSAPCRAEPFCRTPACTLDLHRRKTEALT